jgi:hypothetical protein
MSFKSYMDLGSGGSFLLHFPLPSGPIFGELHEYRTQDGPEVSSVEKNLNGIRLRGVR